MNRSRFHQRLIDGEAGFSKIASRNHPLSGLSYEEYLMQKEAAGAGGKAVSWLARKLGGAAKFGDEFVDASAGLAKHVSDDVGTAAVAGRKAAKETSERFGDFYDAGRKGMGQADAGVYHTVNKAKRSGTATTFGEAWDPAMGGKQKLPPTQAAPDVAPPPKAATPDVSLNQRQADIASANPNWSQGEVIAQAEADVARAAGPPTQAAPAPTQAPPTQAPPTQAPPTQAPPVQGPAPHPATQPEIGPPPTTQAPAPDVAPSEWTNSANQLWGDLKPYGSHIGVGAAALGTGIVAGAGQRSNGNGRW